MDPVARNRIVAALVMVAVLVLGGYLSGAPVRASKARVESLRAREVSAEQAQRDALARDLKFSRDQAFFAAHLASDLERFGLADQAVTVEQLKQPQAFFHPLDAPVKLRPGRSFSSEHVRVRATVEKVTFRQRSAAVSARHSVATIENISEGPIAYSLKVGPSDGRKCRARGARMHNAMALVPGETAEIVVCAGAGKIALRDLRVLELSPVGYYYVSKIPPVAVGHDAVTAQAHRPPQPVSMCTNVPAVRLAEAIRAGTTAWEDVVDFYSRHNCQQFDYPSGYERAEQALSSLPVTGEH